MADERNDLVWIAVDPSAVPEGWKERALSVALLPMLPGEASRVLETLVPLGHEDPTFLSLVARGASPRSIARELGLSIRSVHRRTARLKELLGVESSAQLSASLARRGF